jgi:hypothetical protein
VEQRDEAPDPRSLVPPPVQRSNNPGHFARSEHRVDLRNLGPQLIAVSFGHAAGHNQSAAGAGLLVFCHFEDGVDRLLLCLVDEGAGVDDEHVGVRGLARQFMSSLPGESEHHL